MPPKMKHVKREEQYTRSPLPAWERYLYLLSWVGAVAYCYINIFTASREYAHQLNEYDFGPGWIFSGRKRDSSDNEWEFWHREIKKVIPFIILHIIMNQGLVALKVHSTYRRVFITTHDTAVVLYTNGLLPGLVLVLSCVLSYFVAAGTSSKVCCWVASIGLLSLLNFEPFITWAKLLCGGGEGDPYGEVYYMFVFTSALVHVRCTSFMLEYCSGRTSLKTAEACLVTKQNKDRKVTVKSGPAKQRAGAEKRTHHQSEKLDGTSENLPNLFDLLEYTFYLPLYTFGPIVTYNCFLSKDMVKIDFPTLQSKFLDIVRPLFWCVFLEGCLHFLYYSAIHHDVWLMNEVPLWTLAGTGFCKGQMFMVKYMVIYGLPRGLASLDDRWAPSGPICIARVSHFSKIWQGFDKGMYIFIKSYIYVPIGGSQQGYLRQVLASATCFAFIFYWHGAEFYLFVWVFMNFVGILLESAIKFLSRYLRGGTGEQGAVLSEANIHRLNGILGVPLAAISYVAIFCFFFGVEKGMLFYHRIIVGGWPVSTVTFFFFFYAMVQTSAEIELWEKGRKYKQLKQS